MRNANERRSIELEGLSHGDLPIPAASRVGPLLATGGVRGVDRETGVLAEGAAAQTRHMFANLRALIEAADADLESIVKITVWVTDRATRRWIDEEWRAMFPNPKSRPARHLLTAALPGAMLVQCDALAFVQIKGENNRG